MKTAGCLILLLCLLANTQAQPKKPATGIVKIFFNNRINNHPVVLNDSTYTNPFGESYIIKKLKYYISNTVFYSGGKPLRQKNRYWLVNQAIDSSLSIRINLPENNYDSIGFLLGVDSARNTSGAQTGALDPLNDMFWTWHSGYIMEKMEGSSPQSKIVNNKFEYHIGGYEGENSALNFINLRLPADKKLSIQKGKMSTIIITVDINKFWDSGYRLTISETPVCSTPGILAKQIAGNFSKLFSVEEVTN
ncbi:MAG: hypothetical protein IPP72_04340 [Chitinophagaceae bacterium]|nr:hypothetical protein [Chitinophagaceae bacterium]